MTLDLPSTISAGITGIVSGVVVSLVNHWLTKRKTAAEIEKLQAEAELTRAQAKQITDNLNNLSNKLSYKLPEAPGNGELILFAADNADLFDFRITKVDNADGDLAIADGILSIRRTNTQGTLQCWLESYAYAGQDRLRALPKDDSISGDRKLRVSCEVKTVGGEHTLLFLMKGDGSADGVHMADKRYRVTSNEWVAVEAYFRVSPDQGCRFRIDDRSVSAANSSVQIRKLVLAQHRDSLQARSIVH